MRNFLHHLVYEQGFVFPLRIVSLGSDGSMLAGRYQMDNEKRDAVFSMVARYLPQGGLSTPVTAAYFDANDRGALMIMGQPHMERKQ
jgi:hypothetical protein